MASSNSIGTKLAPELTSTIPGADWPYATHGFRCPGREPTTFSRGPKSIFFCQLLLIDLPVPVYSKKIMFLRLSAREKIVESVATSRFIFCHCHGMTVWSEGPKLCMVCHVEGLQSTSLYLYSGGNIFEVVKSSFRRVVVDNRYYQLRALASKCNEILLLKNNPNHFERTGPKTEWPLVSVWVLTFDSRLFIRSGPGLEPRIVTRVGPS